jgi:hypothetical protein
MQVVAITIPAGNRLFKGKKLIMISVLTGNCANADGSRTG